MSLKESSSNGFCLVETFPLELNEPRDIRDVNLEKGKASEGLNYPPNETPSGSCGQSQAGRRKAGRTDSVSGLLQAENPWTPI